MRSSLAAATAGWGLLMALAPLLQVRMVLRNRSADGVSVGWLAVLLVGFVLWLSYGVAIGDAPLVVSNIVSTAVGVLTLGVVLAFRRRRPVLPPPTPQLIRVTARS